MTQLTSQEKYKNHENIVNFFKPFPKCQRYEHFRAANEIVSGITFSVKKKENPPNVDGFKLYLSSREEYNDFHMDYFNVHGDELIAYFLDSGYKHFTMKLSKEFYLGLYIKGKQDEKNICRPYQICQTFHIM